MQGAELKYQDTLADVANQAGLRRSENFKFSNENLIAAAAQAGLSTADVDVGRHFSKKHLYL
jgi:hypothetical protein